MKNKPLIALLMCIVLSLACNIPTGTATSAPSVIEPAKGASATVPPPTATIEPTATFPPVDITFSIDCSGVDASRQTDCDVYIANTRDTVYPILREITGVSLSDCYKNINYTILEGNPSEGAGGYSTGPEIVFAKEYSIDPPEKFDGHELLHSINTCSGALDEHMMHGIVLNTLYTRMGGEALTYIGDVTNAADLLTYQLEAVKTASGDDLFGMCRGILGNNLDILFFDLDQNAVTTLYRSTINPQPASAPNDKLKSIWGESAPKVQVLLETLETQYKYPIDVPECGY